MRGCNRGSVMGVQARQQDSVFGSRSHFRFYAKTTTRTGRRGESQQRSLSRVRRVTNGETKSESASRDGGGGEEGGEGSGLYIEQRHVQQGASHSGELPRPCPFNVRGHGEPKENKKREEPRQHEPANTERRRTEWAEERTGGKDGRGEKAWVGEWVGGSACIRKGGPTCRSGQHSESGGREGVVGVGGRKTCTHADTCYRRGCSVVDKRTRIRQ